MIQNVINCKVIFSESGVSMTPLVASDGGRQGENRATVVKFSIEGLNVENAELTHRVDVVDALGIQHPSEIVSLGVGDYSSIEISHEIERAVTAFGGLVEINAVITAGGKTLKTPALKILFRELKTDDSEILEEANSAFAQLMKLSSATDDYAKSARESAEKAEEAKNIAQDFMDAASRNAEASADEADKAEASAKAAAESQAKASTAEASSSESASDAKKYCEEAKILLGEMESIRGELCELKYKGSPTWGKDTEFMYYAYPDKFSFALGCRYKVAIKGESTEGKLSAQFVDGSGNALGTSLEYQDGYYIGVFDANKDLSEASLCLALDTNNGVTGITDTMATVNPSIVKLYIGTSISERLAELTQLQEDMGDVEKAIDEIIAIQESIIGGDTV